MTFPDAPLMAEPAVIPDSIEPYRGFKALTIGADLMLYSPSESGIQWPVMRRLEAYCTRGLSQWSWVPIEGEPRKTEAVAMVPHNRPIAVTAVAVSSTSWGPTVPNRGPKPSNPLPPGWNWSWEPLTHEAPAEGCTCGIYAVSTPGDCISYVRADGVIVEVALWGNVVPASNGVRGQYAYPQRILAPSVIVDEVRPTAELYGIEILVLDPPAPRREPEQVDVSSIGDPVKKMITMGTTPIDPAQRVAELIAAEVNALKAMKDAAKKLKGD